MNDHATTPTIGESPRPVDRSNGPQSTSTRYRLKRAGTAAMGTALLLGGLKRRSVPGTAFAVVGVWLLARAFRSRGHRVESEEQNAPTSRPRATGMTVERAITIGAAPTELAGYLRDPSQLDRLVGDTIEVVRTGEGRHRWSVAGPLGRQLAWETRIVEDRPGERLRWVTENGAMLSVDGAAEFRPAPADRGTELTLQVQVQTPGGQLGAAILEQVGLVPASLVGKALDRLKSLAETGEIQTLEGNPSARGTGDRI